MDWIAPTIRESIGVEFPVQDIMEMWRSSFSPRSACFGFDVTQQIDMSAYSFKLVMVKQPSCLHGTLEFKMLNTIQV